MKVSEAIQVQKDFVARKYHIYNYNNKQLKESMRVLTKAYTDLEGQYNDLDSCYSELEINNSDLLDQLEDLKYSQPDNKTMILDLQLFKEKLDLYGLANEELLNFIDDYMKLYNKE